MSNPVYFPQVGANGVMTQLPYEGGISFNTAFQDNANSRPYSFAKWGGGLTNFPTGPLGKFTAAYTAITDAEIAALLAFHGQQLGRLTEFVFLDPGGNLIDNSEDFTQTSWTSQMTSVTLAATGVTDPFGGTRASTLTATSSNSNMTPIVVPGGYLPTGWVMCVSAYVMALSAGQTLEIGFVDSGFTVLGSQTWTLPQNSWVRIWFSMTFNTTSYIRALFGGSGTWNSTSIDFFGPQCVPMPGPGAYIKSPDFFGYHQRCRFDTDTFSYQSLGPNQNAVSLPIAEYFVS